MKVLIINGYSTTPQGDKSFEKFRIHVEEALNEAQRGELDKVQVLIKHRDQLDMYLFELNSEFSDKNAIKKFDQIDMVFVDGPVNEPPWSKKLKKVYVFLKMCFVTKKCVFGSGFTATMLAFLCSTAGERVNVLNRKPKAGQKQDITDFVPPKETKRGDVFLERETGDFYQLERQSNRWIPAGNTGIVAHSVTRPKNYGTHNTPARGSGRRPRFGLDGPTYTSKLGEVDCCARLHLINHWILSRLTKRDFLVRCTSIWDLDEDITLTSATRYQSIIDSSRGPLLIEYQNFVATHFIISPVYSVTLKILKTYVKQKYMDIKIHEHLDQSYTAALSGIAGRKNNETSARSRKSKSSLQPASSGKTSGQRPASPKRTGPQTATLFSSRTSNRPLRQERISFVSQNDATSLENDKGNQAETEKPKKQVRRVKSATRQRPFCAFNKFKQQQEQDRPGSFFSVRNDGPYRTPYEHERVDYMKSKVRWKGGPFRVHFGRASSPVIPTAGIVNTGEYRADLTHHNILNRADRPDKFVDPSRRFQL